MNLELKKIKTFIGTEGEGLNADLYANGKKVAFVIDNGDGNEVDFQAYNKTLLQDVKDYVESLSPVKYEGSVGYIDLGIFIDTLYEKAQREKENKKIIKKMDKSIMYGVPNSDGYTEIACNASLSVIPVTKLQDIYDRAIKLKLVGDVKLFNTNLEALGVKL